MDNQKKRQNPRPVSNRPRSYSFANIALALAILAQMPLAASAANDGELKADVPTVDTTPSGPAPAEPAHNPTTTLTGAVETAAQDETSPAFKLAIQKLAAGEELSSDDFRSLGIGILGYEANRPFFFNTGNAEIINLFPGCPAAEAGIKLGDWEISGEDPEAQKDTHGLTRFICGLAGKPVDITIERRGRKLQFHLVRMNVEDIPDDRLRKIYERLIRRMGQKLARAYPQLDPKTVGQ